MKEGGSIEQLSATEQPQLGPALCGKNKVFAEVQPRGAGCRCEATRGLVARWEVLAIRAVYCSDQSLWFA